MGPSALSAWITWRLAKFVALALLAGGVAGTLTSSVRRDRLALAYGAVVPGLIGTWAAGWMLMKATHRSPEMPWIAVGIAASMVALFGIFLASHSARSHRLPPVLAVGGLIAAVAVMVLQSADPVVLGGTVAVSGVLGGFATRQWTGREVTTDPEDAEAMHRGFRWLAWAEGGSLLFMLGISMPLKYGLHLDIDGGSGVIGWIHGGLFIAYLQSLTVITWTLGWSWQRCAVGAIAGLVPGAPFVFERWLSPPVHTRG